MDIDEQASQQTADYLAAKAATAPDIGSEFRDDTSRLKQMIIEKDGVPPEDKVEFWSLVNPPTVLGNVDGKDLEESLHARRSLFTLFRMDRNRTDFTFADLIREKQVEINHVVQSKRARDGFERKMGVTENRNVRAEVGSKKKSGWSLLGQKKESG